MAHFCSLSSIGNAIHLFWSKHPCIEQQKQDPGSSSRVVIRAPKDVKCACIIPSGDVPTANLMVALQDQSLWQIALNEIVDVNSIEPATSKELQETRGIQSKEEDVFADLLQEKSCSDKESSSSEYLRKPLYLESKHFVCVINGNIVDFASSSDTLYVLLVKNEQTFLAVYSCMNNLSDRPNVTKSKLVKEIPTSLSADFFSVQGITRKSLYMAMDEKNLQLGLHDCASTILLPSPVFISLFGKSGALAQSPVLLLATNQGLVHYYILKTASMVERESFSVCCHLFGSIVKIGTVRLKIPNQDNCPQQKILQSLTSALASEKPCTDSDFSTTGLLFVSALGEGCMFLAPVTNLPSVISLTVPKGIKQCILVNSDLICDTGYGLVITKFSVTPEVGNCKISTSTKVIYEGENISHLLPFSIGGKFGNDAEPSVTVLTQNGLLFSMPLKESSASDVTSGSVKDSLTKIRKSSEKSKVLKEKSSLVDSFLCQLNILSKIKHSKLSCSEEQLIQCKCNVSSRQSGYERIWSLDMTIHNEMNINLGKDWMILVAITPKTSFPEPFYKGLTFSYSLSLGLEKNSSMELSFPLKDCFKGRKITTINIVVSLALTFPEAKGLFNELKTQHMPTLQSEIFSNSFDILQFFHVARTLCTNMVTRGRNDLDFFGRRIMAMSKSHQYSDCQEQSNIENVSADVCLINLKALDLQTPVKVLKYLFVNSQVREEDLTGSSVQLVTPAGEFVTLTVSFREETLKGKLADASGASDMVLTISGWDAETVYEVRRAIRLRLKPCVKTMENIPEDSQQLQRNLKELQDIRQKLVKIPPTSVENVDISSLFKLCADV